MSKRKELMRSALQSRPQGSSMAHPNEGPSHKAKLPGTDSDSWAACLFGRPDSSLSDPESSINCFRVRFVANKENGCDVTRPDKYHGDQAVFWIADDRSHQKTCRGDKNGNGTPRMPPRLVGPGEIRLPPAQ